MLYIGKSAKLIGNFEVCVHLYPNTCTAKIKGN